MYVRTSLHSAQAMLGGNCHHFQGEKMTEPAMKFGKRDLLAIAANLINRFSWAWLRFTILTVLATMLGAAEPAHGACTTTYFEKAYLNEYYFGTSTNYLEVYIPNNNQVSSADWSSWYARVYTGATTYTSYPLSGATACVFGSKTYLAYNVPGGLPGTGGAVNVVLYDGNGNEIDYLKFDNSSPISVYQAAQCAYAASHDIDLEVSNYGNKDVARFPDGNGDWSISSLTGANTTNTRCAPNDTTIIKTVSASAIPVGSPASFTITAFNPSNSALSSVAVTDALPPGLIYDSHTASTGNSTYIPSTGVWTIGLLAKNTSATLAINFHGNTAGTYTNTATLNYSGITYTAKDSAIANITQVLNHIRLEHTGSGLTCTPSSVTVKACADTACTTLYTGGTTTVTLSPSSGWVTNPITFTGSTTVNLSVTTPSTITLGTTATSPTPSGSSPQCYVGATATCSHTFADTGFIFSSIPTQIAGVTSGNLTIQAVKKADNSTACTGLFTGNAPISMASQCIDPTTCAGKQVTINSTAIANNPASGISSYTPVTLNFGASSTATFPLNYPDVGAMQLSARYLPGGSDYMVGASNTFVIKPFGFTLTGIKRTSDNFANPAAANATDEKFIKAGDSFTATVTAIANGGAATPNYGKEISPEGVKLTSTLVIDLGLTNNPALSNGTIAGGSFTSGVATPTDLAWNEVGIITLIPSVADASYLGIGDVTGAASFNIGRFYPDHFAFSSGSIVTRTDMSPACSPASDFTYMGEPFKAGFTLTAQGPSPGNVTLQNYVSSGTPANNFAKLATGTPIPAGFGLAYLDGATDLTARFDSSLGIADSWAGGVLAATATLDFTRNTTPDGPYNAMKVGVAPVDSDGVALSVFDMDVAAPVGNDHAQVGQTQIRFGRLRLSNAHGSELLDLPVPMEAQYWNGTLFTTNTLDNCTTIALGNIALSTFQGNLAACETAVSISGTLNAGKANLKMLKPGAGNSGSVDLTVNLGSSVLGSTCLTAGGAASVDVPANRAYLQGKWSGTGYDKNPSSRATFGAYKSGPIIYMRENF